VVVLIHSSNYEIVLHNSCVRLH